MAKDERQASGMPRMRLLEGGQLGKRSSLVETNRILALKTEPVGVLGRARVKQLLGKFVTSPWNGRLGLKHKRALE